MVKVGDRVGYSRAFLQSTGSDYWMSKRRGIVVSIDPDFGPPPGLAAVSWDQEPGSCLKETRHVLAVNLAKVGTAEF